MTMIFVEVGMSKDRIEKKIYYLINDAMHRAIEYNAGRGPIHAKKWARRLKEIAHILRNDEAHRRE